LKRATDPEDWHAEVDLKGRRFREVRVSDGRRLFKAALFCHMMFQGSLRLHFNPSLHRWGRGGVMRLQLGTGGHSGRGAAWRTSCMELLGQKENTEMRTSATTQTRHYEAVSRLYDILCLWKSEFKGRDYIAHAFPGGSPSYLVSNNKERDPMSHQIYCQFYL
jgi:hypothetical protein